ncbi:MAG: hypothetical protein HGA45_04335 [Chloroflexales bacterium]|nr:hypothetical protein [Chloroflexales bacterium]
MSETTFAQLATFGASVTLFFGFALLWRRSPRAHISAFRYQSVALVALFALVGYATDDRELYIVAAVLCGLKVVVMPWYLLRLERDVGADRELRPYVNVATSILLAGALILLAYAATWPLVEVSRLPTRGGLPLAMGLIFLGLLVVVTRKQALAQIVGFLMLENGAALLALLGTFGIPLVVELGVFLDVLLGLLVMQIFVYHIRTTFESLDVEQLNQLKH